MTDFNKLADALDITANWLGGGLAATLKDIANIREAVSILRAAGAADVAALMELASTLEYTAYDDGSNGKGDTPECDAARAALESALRVAMAQRAGFVMVPVEPTEAMLEAAHNGDREYTLRNFGDIMTVMQGPYDHWRAMIAASQAGAQEALK